MHLVECKQCTKRVQILDGISTPQNRFAIFVLQRTCLTGWLRSCFRKEPRRGSHFKVLLS